MTVLTECQYFPPVILIKAAIDLSNVKFDVYDVHRKMSFRNRCVLAGGAGPVNLSVPLVEGRNQRRPLKEVRIDNKTDWRGQHWKTITSCYNRSPWFEFYKHELEELYRQPAEWLVDWNRVCWDWLIKKLEAGVNTSYTEEYRAGYDPVEFLDWRNKLMPRSMEKEFPEPVRYGQVFEDRHSFIPHLSVLDMLFCEGRRTVEILKSSKIPI
jgi:hypothetical protein